MKTIEQIFKDVGEKFPFKVWNESWSETSYFHCVARAPVGRWIGWGHDGKPNFLIGDAPEWELCQEPKKTEKRYEWLVELNNKNIFISDSIISEKDAKRVWPSAKKLIKLREFDIEVE